MSAQSKGSGSSIKGKSALAEFCRDLCEEARCGRIDPVRLVCRPARRCAVRHLLAANPGSSIDALELDGWQSAFKTFGGLGIATAGLALVLLLRLTYCRYVRNMVQSRCRYRAL